ncbi:MAG: endonuclease G [Crocinitomicaceae bacterium]|jgi:endonuclease G
MNQYFSVFLILVSYSSTFAQVNDPQVDVLEQKLNLLNDEKSKIQREIDQLKLSWIRKEIKTIGIPLMDGDFEVAEHTAMILSYNESHEQANWVEHIILPDVTTGNFSRSNDFREDPMITTGTAVEADYFLKTLKSDSSYAYDGFGYDRGHLAPSADFRWSETALSESYFYSNMSPQLGDFNRQKWAELEGLLRSYVEGQETHLIVVTAPVLRDNLPTIERGVNKISIPEYYVKTALDLKNKRGIAYVMPNMELELPVEAYAVTIDSAERLLGLDLFPNLEDSQESLIESNFDIDYWLADAEKGDAIAIDREKLPKKAINTYEAAKIRDKSKRTTVCGTVVSSKKHNKGHVFLNLDKKFPNQIFSVTIFESSIKNFQYQPEVYLINQKVCVTGTIGDYNGTPSMVLENDKQVKLLNEF